MKLDELYRAIDRAAPFSLSGKMVAATGGYDNSGILVRAGERADTALFCLDLSDAALAAASEVGADVIVTHHPAVWKGLTRIEKEGAGRAVFGAVAAGISVISAHLNADIAANGVDRGLAEGLGAKKAEVLSRIDGALGYGRAFRVEEQTLSAFSRRAAETFGSDKMFVYGDAERKISRVCSFCGAGGDEEDLALALRAGCDVMVSADFPHHVVAEAVSAGLCVLEMTHYASENYGFQKIFRQVKQEVGAGAKCVYFTDARLL